MKYLKHDIPAICQRCQLRGKHSEMVSDANIPGLMVHPHCRDNLDPYRLAPRSTEDITLAHPRPDAQLLNPATLVTPQSIPDLIANFDATIGVADAGGGAVSSWTDSAFGSISLTQANSVNRPITGTRTINGVNAIDFDGTNDVMEFPSSLYSVAGNDVTIFVVLQSDNVGDATQRIIHGQDTNNSRMIVSLLSGSMLFNNRFNAIEGASFGAATLNVNRDTVPHVAVLWKSTVSQAIFRDGGQPAINNNASPFTLTQLRLGAQLTSSNRFNGLIGQVLIYNRALEMSEIQQVGADILAPRWGVNWTSVV